MQERVIKVFFGEDCLPYKDSERSVHFPILGSAFMNASNTTEIRFYCKDIGGDNRTWIVIGKLPNGKRGFKFLGSSQTDSETGEKYFSFHLNQFFTQYKGDLYLSLGGYSGALEELEEYDTYELSANAIVETTGAIKLNIAYATPLSGSDTEIDTWQGFLAELGTKANKDQVIIKYTLESTLYSEYSNFDDYQAFYCVQTNRLYMKYEDELVVLTRFDIGFITFTRLAITTSVTDEQLIEITKPHCLAYDIYSGRIYIKSRYLGNVCTFASPTISSDSTGSGDEQYTTLRQDGVFEVNTETKALTLVSTSLTLYNQNQSNNRFAIKSGDNEFTGTNTFSAYLPQSEVEATNPYDLPNKDYVDTNVDNVNTALTNHKNDTSNPHQVTKGQVGLGNVDNVKQVPMSYLNPNNEGYTRVAPLDNGKLPIEYIPDAVLGQVEYCGNFDASSNQDQTIRTPRKGDYYICNNGGYHLPNGVDTESWEKPIDFEVGDWAIYDGTAWEKIDNTDAVQSVNGKTGAVVLDKTDVGLGNVDNTSDLNKPISTATQNALNTKLGKDEASGLYQTKIIAYPLLNIATSSWEQDINSGKWYYEVEVSSEDLSIGANDKYLLGGNDKNTSDELATNSINVEDIVTNGATTTITLVSNFQPTIVLNVSIVIAKVTPTTEAGLTFFTTNDLGSGLSFYNNKVRVNPSLEINDLSAIELRVDNTLYQLYVESLSNDKAGISYVNGNNIAEIRLVQGVPEISNESSNYKTTIRVGTQGIDVEVQDKQNETTTTYDLVELLVYAKSQGWIN